MTTFSDCLDVFIGFSKVSLRILYLISGLLVSHFGIGISGQSIALLAL